MVLACAWLIAAGAAAQGTAEPPAAGATPVATGDQAQNKAIARALFQEGLGHVDEERWAEAADRFQRVLQLQWSSAAAFNLAAALDHLERPVEATEVLHRVLQEGSTDGQLRSAAEAMLDDLRSRQCRLTIRLQGDSGGVSVQLDTRSLPSAAVGAPIPVDPGAHRVRALRDGAVLAEESVFLGGDNPRALEVKLDLSGAALAPETAAASVAASEAAMSMDDAQEGQRDGIHRKWWFWTAIGVTAALVVTALIVFPIEQTGDPVQGDFSPAVVRVSVP